jgi:hypothetical protein
VQIDVGWQRNNNMTLRHELQIIEDPNAEPPAEPVEPPADPEPQIPPWEPEPETPTTT